MNTAPVILFVYNRPLHTKMTVESLQRNGLAGETHLIVYADQAKNKAAEVAVEQTRSYLRTIQGFKNVTIVERTENYGLARNIIEGVTEVITKSGRVIVMEDDLVTSPYFLKFMNDALNVYENDSKVGHIQGYCYDLPGLPDTFFTQWIGSWGWATWKRAWDTFETDGSVLLKRMMADRSLAKGFDFNARYVRMLRHQTKGKNNSWAVRWHASCYLNGLVALNTGRSLVQNIGFDGSGTHCEVSDEFNSDVFKNPVKVVRLEETEQDRTVRRLIAAHNKKRNSLFARARNRFRNSPFNFLKK